MAGECPIGAVIMFGGGKDRLPSGWLYCDGRIINQAEYPDLFKAVGHSFGNLDARSGYDPNSQFFLPDLRGRFIRGVDDGGSRDPDAGSRTDMQNNNVTSAGVGSVQPDDLRSHTHKYEAMTKENPAHGESAGNYWEFQDDNLTKPSGGNETRPLNAALYFIIRAS